MESIRFPASALAGMFARPNPALAAPVAVQPQPQTAVQGSNLSKYHSWLLENITSSFTHRYILSFFFLRIYKKSVSSWMWSTDFLHWRYAKVYPSRISSHRGSACHLDALSIELGAWSVQGLVLYTDAVINVNTINPRLKTTLILRSLRYYDHILSYSLTPFLQFYSGLHFNSVMRTPLLRSIFVWPIIGDGGG